MDEVGIRQLRNELSRWIEKATKGQEIVITERGRPVARLVPAGWRSKYQQLVDEGIITPPEKPAQPSSSWKPIKAKGTVSDLIKEQPR